MRMLIAIDRSEYAPIVIEQALDHAVRTEAGDLHFVTAVGDEAEIEPARRWLDAMVRDLCETFACQERTIALHVRCDPPITAVAALAAELAPDVLVIGRFHVPSAADALLDLVACPTLVVGVEGHDLEPQCLDCEAVRRDSEGDRLFCEAHAGDYLPDLAMRLPVTTQIHSRLW